MTDYGYYLRSSRSQAYLTWLVLVTIGFVATHFYQDLQINALWFVISIIGLTVMFRVMPMRVNQMKLIFLAWAVPITFGMVMSALTHLDPFNVLIPYLVAFWLLVMSVGYLWNGLVDEPFFWYGVAAAANIVAAALCYLVPEFTAVQYLVAAVVTAWSMGNLWLFRSA